LVEVIEEYRLLPESLYSAVQYLDRYLSVRSVTRQRLQLLGCACMLIAAKFEEIYMPMAEEFVYITDNAYDRAAILEMEQEVLQVLDYSVKCATAKHFMTRYLHAADASRGDFTTNIVKYLCELSLLEYRFLEYRPSQITAAAVLVGHRMQGLTPAWTPTLVHYTGYTQDELEMCAADLSSAHADAPKLPIEAVYKKYTHSPYMRVASKATPLELPVGYVVRPSCTASLAGNTY
jgi:cyclin A